MIDHQKIKQLKLSMMSHKELVEICYKWMVKNGRVGVVFKELKSRASEIPDVIGFDSWQSILIECKVSRADFFNDKNKAHKKIFKGMGNWRYFACPKGMIKVSELPEKWGLIYVHNGKARIEYDCQTKEILIEEPSEWDIKNGRTHRIERANENRFDIEHDAERAMMYTALRRLFLRGYLKTIYETI